MIQSLLPVLLLSLSPARAPQESADPTRLLPPQATIVVRVDSAAALSGLVNELAPAFSPDADEVTVAMLLEEPMGVPGDHDQVDPERPLWVALSIGLGGVQPTFAVPARDAAVYAASLPEGFVATVLGDYVGVAASAITPAAEVHPSAAKLGPGMAVARIELGALIEAFRPMLESGLDQFEMMMDSSMDTQDMPFDVAPLMELYIDWLWAAIDSADVLEVAFERRGDELSLHTRLEVLPGSPMEGLGGAGSPLGADTLRWIDPAQPIVFGASADWPRIMALSEDFMQALYDLYPEDLRAGIQQLYDGQRELATSLGRQLVGSGSLGPDGMRVRYFMEAADPARVLGQLEGILAQSGSASFGISDLGAAEIGGRRALRYRVKMDLEQIAAMAGEEVAAAETEQLKQFMQSFMGPDGMAMTVTTVPRGLLMLLGGDEAEVSAAIKAPAGQLPADFLYGLELMGSGDPATVYRVDLATLIQQMKPLMETMGEDLGELDRFEGAKIPYTIWGALEKSAWRGGFVIGMDAVAEMGRVMGDDR